MKKISFLIIVAAGLVLSACHSPKKTGDDRADSGSAGSSGASDTTQSIKGSPSLGTNASGDPADSRSDTTTIKH